MTALTKVTKVIELASVTCLLKTEREGGREGETERDRERERQRQRIQATKGVNQLSEDFTRKQQQSAVSPTWHARKYDSLYKLHQRHTI